MRSTEEGRYLTFYSDAVEPHTLQVATLEGREAVSAPYRFELDLVSAKSDLDSSRLLANPARIGIKQAMGKHGQIRTLWIHGTLALFEQCENRRDAKRNSDWVVYRAVLVPRIWNLSLDVRSRIFLDRSLPEIADEILREAGLERDRDFAWSVDLKKYAKREYVVQYQESTLNFLHRWLEHEGLFYSFVQEDDHERIVFGDSPTAWDAAGEAAPYRPGVKIPKSWLEEETIAEFSRRHQRVSAQVVVKDYNYRTYDVGLRADAAVSKDGVGVRYEYGDHHKTPEDGERLARIRAEELACREKLFVGAGDVRSFRAGSVFVLDGHYQADFNRDYVLLEVEHIGEQAIVLGETTSHQSYRNSFTCIPGDIAYRSQRKSQKPTVQGLLNAKIDGAKEGECAEIDSEGRYKVVVPFDLSGRGGGKATHWIRMAQPYVGSGYGMHFPCHKGTEVLLAHVNGDPDRPVIVGAVPNPETPSPVVDKNHTQGVLQSAANNAVLFEDLQDEERFLIRAQKNHEIRVGNDTLERVARDRHLVVERNQIERIANDRHENVGRDDVLEVGGSRHVSVTAHDSKDVGGQLSVSVQGDAAHVFLANHSENTTGSYYLKADSGVVVESPAGITLLCGGSSVVIDAAGVTIAGAAVTLDGAQTKINSGPGSAPAAGVEVAARSPRPAASPSEPGDLEAGSTKAEGTGAEEEAGPSDASWISIELKDADGKPIPRELYQAVFPNGRTVRGRLDKEGKARIEGVPSGEAKITFPRRDKGEWKKG